ncbi:hypothetical protein J2S43_004539 [Catenuloplanes nepalensis]|uniref:Uncharacterized protein n=1 Tax=Catenuloplanes nepalensis TaxID=587533 RepID=A0ABT9MX60_9ACTN|nr:hypothetical protein [Catenuloplanes nepalensis]MDP9796027.1 hypothetical protein [Catenuloplanes nepalensis]
MRANEILLDAFGRLPELVGGAVDGLTPEQLRWAPGDGVRLLSVYDDDAQHAGQAAYVRGLLPEAGV